MYNMSAKRRVFFSFHYQNDIMRVNQVRQSWRFQHESRREAEGFFDGSLWEASQRRGAESVKTLIREGMKNTSVTCVLAGQFTYQRRWVRYEIARSLVKGNGLLNVNIANLRDPNRGYSMQGPSPLDYMGVYRSNTGLRFCELDKAGKWINYNDYTLNISLPAGWEQPGQYVIRLARYGRSYDYLNQNGRANFAEWVRIAAAEAAR